MAYKTNRPDIGEPDSRIGENSLDSPMQVSEMPCYRCAHWSSKFAGAGSWEVTEFSWEIFLELINPFYIDKRNPFYKVTIVCEECNGTGTMYY